MRKKMTFYLLTFLVVIAFATPAFAERGRNDDTRSSSSRTEKKKSEKRRSDFRSRDKGKKGSHRGKDRHDSHRRPRTERRWIPGRYEYQVKYVYHSGFWEEYTIEAVYEYRTVIVTDPKTGEQWTETREICISPARIERKWIPGWTEKVVVRVYIPGKWITVTIR